MKLVLQCAMCGTHHPVGTAVCCACRATGVAQLRLMFECPTCQHLGLNPFCEACLPVALLDEDEMALANEVTESELIDVEVVLDIDEEEPKFVVVEDEERVEEVVVDDGDEVTEFFDEELPEDDSDPSDFELDLGDS